MTMLIFVYGSLRRGQQFHGELQSARYVATVQTEACYELVDLGPYPALIEGGATAITGELYEVDRTLLAQLDAFEEAPEIYQRKPLRIAGVSAEGYVMARSAAGRAPSIASGDWCKR